MKTLSFATALITALLIAGCTEQEVYPLSGEECGPNDPVQDLTVPNCWPGTI